MHERKGKIEGRTLSKGKKVTMLTGTREGRAKERSVGDSLRAAEFDEHEAAVDVFIRFPELGTKS